MKRLLTAAIGCMLLVACGSSASRAPASASTPSTTSGAPIATPTSVRTPAAVGTPTSATPTPDRLLTATSMCVARSALLAVQSNVSLVLTPSTPRGGETVRVTGAGLQPGDYELTSSFGGSNGEARLFGPYPIGKVGPDGVLNGTFVMPWVPAVDVCLETSARTGTSTFAYAAPFVTSGNVVQPGRCEALPNAIPPSDARLAKASTSQPRVGDTVEVTGTGLIVFNGIKSVEAELNVYFDDPRTATRIDGQGSWSANGDFVYRFVVKPNPAFSGRCVEMNIVSAPVGGNGWPGGYVRFEYP